MSIEHIRRRLVVRIGGKPDAVYIDKISQFLLKQEEKKNSQIHVINISKKKESALEFNFENGETYELSNYVDPLRDKPKPKDYKPPEMVITKIEATIEDEPDSSFTIVHFVLLVFFFGLLALSGMSAWLIYNFNHPTNPVHH